MVATSSHGSQKGTAALSQSSLFHGLPQQLDDSQYEGSQGHRSKGWPHSMPEGAQGGALSVVQPWRGKVPLCNGAGDGEDPDLKHQEHAPQQGDIGEGDKGSNP